jgi:hypothetical protein
MAAVERTPVRVQPYPLYAANSHSLGHLYVIVGWDDSDDPIMVLIGKRHSGGQLRYGHNFSGEFTYFTDLAEAKEFAGYPV